MKNREYDTLAENTYNKIQTEIDNINRLIGGLDLLENIIVDFDGKILNKRIETKFKEKSSSNKSYLTIVGNSFSTDRFLEVQDVTNGYSQDTIRVKVALDENNKNRIIAKDTIKNLREDRERLKLKIEGLEKFTVEKIEELQSDGLELSNKIRFYNTYLSKSCSLYDALNIRY